jgi:RNA polymerase sigma factor (sigma-70 family)
VPDENDRNVDNPAVAREQRYPGGFDDFFRTEYRRLVTALMVMGACLAEADDCVAHAMQMLLERWSLQASDPGYVHNPGAYAMKTARRRFTRERHRAQAVALDEVEPALAIDEPALTMLENRQFVANILECLPLAQRQVMYLITEGYRLAEIAEILRKQPNNVRQIAHQAKKRLRPLLEPPATESTHGEDEKS